jgi:cytochrome P450
MRDRLPPGPPLPPLAQAIAYGLRPTEFLRACHRRYGDTITLRLPRVGTFVYLADPADIRTVFHGDSDTYRAGEANGSVLTALLGPTSVLVSDGEDHARRRRLMAPPFHGSAVLRQQEVMAEVAAADVDAWPVGVPFAVHHRMRAITLDVILRTVVGVSDPARLAALRASLPPIVDIRGINLLQFLYPVLRNYWPWRRFAPLQARADEALYAEIARCRADPALDARTDVLAMLVRARDEDGSVMSDAELRDQLITLLLAGHETTATGLAWTVERLVRHPHVLERARQAAADGDDKYLDALVVEALRVRPVITDVTRKVTHEVEIGAHRVPPGVVVSPAIVLVHGSGAQYRDPEVFDPSRWLDDKPDPSIWLPFGGGNRRCLGAAFALTEMRVVLREMLRRVELATTHDKDERPRVRNVTLVPSGGGVVTVRRRLAVASAPKVTSCSTESSRPSSS